jgi:gliding motility-associated-like protein
VQPIPLLDLGADTMLCEGQHLLLNNGVSSSGAIYKWQDGSSSPTYDVSSPGLYFVQENDSGCSSSDSIIVGYKSKPVIEMISDTSICQGQSLTLQPKVSDSANFIWQDGSMLNYLVVSDTGLYQVSVTNICGTAAAQVKVSPGLCYLDMANAFTPNGDGKNDLFRVKYPFTASYFNMSVYDRWGMLVYRSNNMSEGWDGMFHGVPQPSGAYVWAIELIDIHGRKVSSKGTVVLVR